MKDLLHEHDLQLARLGLTLETLSDRVERLVGHLDTIEARMVKQERWRAFVHGIGVAVGALLGYLFGKG